MFQWVIHIAYEPLFSWVGISNLHPHSLFACIIQYVEALVRRDTHNILVIVIPKHKNKGFSHGISLLCAMKNYSGLGTVHSVIPKGMFIKTICVWVLYSLGIPTFCGCWFFFFFFFLPSGASQPKTRKAAIQYQDWMPYCLKRMNIYWDEDMRKDIAAKLESLGKEMKILSLFE